MNNSSCGKGSSSIATFCMPPQIAVRRDQSSLQLISFLEQMRPPATANQTACRQKEKPKRDIACQYPLYFDEITADCSVLLTLALYFPPVFLASGALYACAVENLTWLSQQMRF